MCETEITKEGESGEKKSEREEEEEWVIGGDVT
jgi:hypothetical protein